MISGCTSNSDVVATINDENIVKEQLNKQLVLTEISYALNGYDFPSGGGQRKDLEEKLIKELAESYVLAHLAKNEGIEIEEQKALAQRDTLVDTIVSFFGSDEQYHEFLKEKGQDKDGFDEYLLDLAKENEYISKLYEIITQNTSIRSEEMLTYYEEHIEYYNYSSKSIINIEAEDQKTAQKMYNRIKKKKLSFEEVLKEFEGQKGVDVSDLGPTYYSSNEQEYSEIVFLTKVGEVSSVFESGGKYHIIYVYDEDIQESIPYEEAMTRVEKDVLKATKDAAYKNYVEEQMENYHIRLK